MMTIEDIMKLVKEIETTKSFERDCTVKCLAEVHTDGTFSICNWDTGKEYHYGEWK